MSDKKPNLLPEKSTLRVKSPGLAVSKKKSKRESLGESDDGATKEAFRSIAVMKSADKFKKCVETTRVASSFKKGKEKAKKHRDAKNKDQDKPDHIWDDTIAHLDLGKKRQSVLQREIKADIRHVRLLLPQPEYTTYTVKKKRQRGKYKTVGVLKPAPFDSKTKPVFFCGPKCDKDGQILPYSILGDVETFKREAERQGHFKDILKAQTPIKEAGVAATSKPSPRVIKSPKVSKDRALQCWSKEMKERKLEMKRLADTLGRPEKQLLMSTADDYVGIAKCRRLIAAQNNHPDACFWKLPVFLGSNIGTTLTPLERGIPSTPDLSGDAASVRLQKGTLRKPFESQWFSSSYLKENDKQLDGVLKIHNQMLFDELEVCGKSAPKQQKSAILAIDNIDMSPGENATGVLCGSYKKMVALEEERFTGPCLKVDNIVLKWEKGCYNEGKVAKTGYILLEGCVNKMATSHITLQNCGTTVLKYHWKRSDVERIPVVRPERLSPFYFNHNEGIILPGDTAKIDVHFRSSIPGYFREAWLLGTVPILEAGVRIRFIFRGIAKVKKDYSKETQQLEEMLKKREAVTLCSYLAKELIHDITWHAYLKSVQPQEDTEIPAENIEFAQEKPELSYDSHVVKKFEVQYHNFLLELTECSTPEDNDESLNVPKLAKIIVPMLRRTQQRYSVCYQMLGEGADNIVTYATQLAEKLGLVKIQEATEEQDPISPKYEQKPKGRLSRNSSMLKDKKVEDPNDSHLSPVQKPEKKFSPVYDFRSYKKKKYVQKVNLYDEKVYIMVYSMLDTTVDKMVGLFE